MEDRLSVSNHCSATAAYDVVFFRDIIHTTVSDDPATVSRWIHDITSLYGHPLIVGLDVEWRPNRTRGHQYQNPAATLQLCVGRCCLIYQLLHTPYFPLQLIQFLSYSDHTFVGVGVQCDLEKLRIDHRIGYGAKSLDLRVWAAELSRAKYLKHAGLKTLARTVLGKEMEKPKWVCRSDWDNRRLSIDQVKYACLDAYASAEIGRMLNACTAL